MTAAPCAYCSSATGPDPQRVTSPGEDAGKPLCADCAYWCDGDVMVAS
jgi:hypothetical protein